MDHGLCCGFAFPIMLGEQFYGVMEFFTDQIQPADEGLLQIAGSLGYQIGEFVERTRAQQRLAEREESYRAFTETASDGIMTIDAASTVLLANTAAAEIFGYTVEELIGADLSALMPESMRVLHQAGIARYLETGRRGRAWQAMRVTGRHRAGYEIPLEVSFGEYNRQGKHFFVGVIRDVTERQRLNDMLRQSAKLESLGVLAGGIAHDFNNLLTGILGNVSLALETVGDAHPASGALRDAIEASERAAHLTKQLLAYAGKGRFVIEPTDLSALVREIAVLIQSSIPKHVALRMDLEEPLPPVDADIAQIQQLVMNLVINGAEAIPENHPGTVLVVTRTQEADAPYLAAFGAEDIAPGKYVSLSVHDNGAGMDESTLSRIFDPFFTTKFTGRGLGLAAAAGIVRGHKGALKVFSSPGQGTTFKVLLPMGVRTRSKPEEPGTGESLLGQGLVLVVDDEPLVRRTAKTGLEKYGYSVLTANNGREGVDCFREVHDQLKAVILDMTMPVMSGEEALEQMRLIDPGVPVMLRSGYNEVEAIRRFTGKGLAGFLQKPYTAAALAEELRTAIGDADRGAVQ